MEENLMNYSRAVRTAGRGHQYGATGARILKNLTEFIATSNVTNKTDAQYFIDQDLPHRVAKVGLLLGVAKWQKTFQPNMKRMTLSLREADSLQEEIVAAMVELGADLKTGAAPRGNVARQIQRVLDAAII